jgi:hypothetical protein
MTNWIKAVMLPVAAQSDRKALRQFAWQMAVAVPFLFAGLLPWLFDNPIHQWPFIVSLALLLSAYVLPITLYPIYLMWMVFASILGWTNTQIILGLAYVLLIVPLGLGLRLFGKLGYVTRLDPTVQTYWIDRTTPPRRDNLKEPF